MEKTQLEELFSGLQKLKKISIMPEITGILTPSEFMILHLIKCRSKEAEGVKISDIAEHLLISKPAVSQIINVIEEKGYVERITTKSDRRVVYVRLSQTGSELLDKAMMKSYIIAAELMEKMGEEDINTLIRLVNKLYLAAEEYKKH